MVAGQFRYQTLNCSWNQFKIVVSDDIAMDLGMMTQSSSTLMEVIRLTLIHSTLFAVCERGWLSPAVVALRDRNEKYSVVIYSRI